MPKQQQLLVSQQSFISVDETKNRYRGYHVEHRKAEKKIIKKWGRIEKKGDGYQVKNKQWLGQKEIDIPEDYDDFDSESIYQQICEQRRKRGYVDYSALVF